MLAAAEILRGRIPDFSICVVGDGPLRADLERQVQAMRLAAHFEFVGSVDDVSPYLLGADLFVSTSHIEGMPISVLEAMAWGVPVVASDIPGNRTIVTHEETGLLYPLNDTKALAEVVMLVKQSPDLTTERMQRARRLVEQHYNAASVSIVYEKMYREIVGRDER